MRRVTRRAVGTELPLVNTGLRVTSAATETIFRPRLERHARMAICAAYGEVLAREFEITLCIVVKNILTGLKVTVFALATQSLLVHVVFGVATNRRAVRWRLRKLSIGVTLNALRNSIVQTE